MSIEDKVVNNIFEPEFIKAILSADSLNLIVVGVVVLGVLYFVYKSKKEVSTATSHIIEFNKTMTEFFVTSVSQSKEITTAIQDLKNSTKSLETHITSESTRLQHSLEKDFEEVIDTLHTVEIEVIKHTSNRCGSKLSNFSSKDGVDNGL